MELTKKLCAQSDGPYGSLRVYDDRNMPVKYTYLGPDLKPAPDNNNIIIMNLEYDKRGNNTKVSFYNADGKTLRVSNEGCAGWNNIYDEHGNHIERNFFGTKEEPISPSGIHYAKDTVIISKLSQGKIEQLMN